MRLSGVYKLVCVSVCVFVKCVCVCLCDFVRADYFYALYWLDASHRHTGTYRTGVIGRGWGFTNQHTPDSMLLYTCSLLSMG